MGDLRPPAASVTPTGAAGVTPLRVLFFGEAVTLAHVSRPLALAQTLDRRRYTVAFACGERWANLVEAAGLARYPIPTMSPEEFADRLARGKRLFTFDRLQQYVEAELDLFRRTSPDLVIGDFRVSLRISTATAGLPYVALANAYWSPFSTLPFPVPEHPCVDVLGARLARLLLPLALPFAFKVHTGDFNRLCRWYGLPIVRDIRDMYTAGTWTLYLDIPSLAPTADLPATHQYLGPVIWEVPVAPPPWWERLATDPAVVYVALGSSGNPRSWGPLLEALAGLPVRAAVASAGHRVRDLPPNVFSADYLPGLAVISRAKLVISNGGSPTAYQALSRGIPLMGLPSNADQYLMMESVARQGAGILLRSGEATAPKIRAVVQELLHRERYREAASRLQVEIGRFSAERAFVGFLDGLADRRSV